MIKCLVLCRDVLHCRGNNGDSIPSGFSSFSLSLFIFHHLHLIISLACSVSSFIQTILTYSFSQILPPLLLQHSSPILTETHLSIPHLEGEWRGRDGGWMERMQDGFGGDEIQIQNPIMLKSS